MSTSTSTQPPAPLDPPFRGYIETTFDALLVFEAARRGMIPRVTRRLIERERGMVQSGAVFVFDEQESGIKRWTDGLIWSPSRILGNFLVYREADKRSINSATPISSSGQSSPSQLPAPRVSTTTAGGIMAPPYPEGSSGSSITPPQLDLPLGQGALQRPRSASDSAGFDKQRERQLVGSLTNSYKFKDRGLVKKTMSVSVNGYAQHMISYYSVDDVLAGRLRCPSTIPELAALEISADYLHKQNFRFPPMIEVGQDGIPRYRGEPDEPTSPQTPASGASMGYPGPSDMQYDPYGAVPPLPPSAAPPHYRLEHSPGNRPSSRAVTTPMPPHVIHHPQPPPGPSYFGTSPGYYDSPAQPIPIQRSASAQNKGNGARPASSSRRFDPYGGSQSPRNSHASIPINRRQSQPPPPLQPPHPGAEGYHHHPTGLSSSYDMRPIIESQQHSPFAYQPPSTAPASFANLYDPNPSSSAPGPVSPIYASAPPPHPPHTGYSHWQASSPSGTSRLLPAPNRDYSGPPSTVSTGTTGQGSNPPGSAGSNESIHSKQPGSAGTRPESTWPGPSGQAGGGGNPSQSPVTSQVVSGGALQLSPVAYTGGGQDALGPPPPSASWEESGHHHHHHHPGMAHSHSGGTVQPPRHSSQGVYAVGGQSESW